MSDTYKSVGWNRQKKIYDLTLLGGIAIYLAAFVATGLLVRSGTTAETLLIRAFGTAALLLLHVALSIGPLARFDRRFLPLLYNRRHLGVATFVLGLVHGAFSLVQFHALGDVNPLVSLLTANTRFTDVAQFPFQPLGFAALLILFLMAATSHDFWLKQLTAPWWKRLHMAVYFAYALLVGHVALGILQAETHPAYAIALALGITWLVVIHLLAAHRERQLDGGRDRPGDSRWVAACATEELNEGKAKIVCIGGERVAVFSDQGRVSALSNVCQHQNGPLGEGRIVDACVVCPWHGYEYRLEDGRSPEPFTERVPTFNVRIADDTVWVDPRPNPAGTPAKPALLAGEALEQEADDFYVGYRPQAPARVARHLRRTVAVLYLIAAGTAVGLAAWQSPFADSTFEYGTLSQLEGRLTSRPYPMLHLDAADPVLLVGLGKRGADEQVAALHEHRVRIEGQRIARGGEEMLELTADGIEDLGPANQRRSSFQSLGERTLRGEIVDSKCHLGVMKPGEGKTHRACAARCISGGAPPMLWVRDGQGGEARYLLVGRDGRRLGSELLEMVAEPVETTGELVVQDGLRLLRTEPHEIRRITDGG